MSEEKKATLDQIPGFGAVTVQKLVEMGYDNLTAIAAMKPSELANASGVTESTARKAIKFALDSCGMDFKDFEQLEKERAEIIKITTGSEVFDVLLGGGVESRSITEFYAEFGGGKTQFAHLLAVNCLKRFPDSTVVYIDSEGSFRPERINQFAEGVKLDPEIIKKQIKVARAYNTDHQAVLVNKVQDMVNEGLDVKMLIVDSLTSHFRSEFIGRGSLSERQQKLNHHMATLSKIADVNNMVVYVTNQVMSRPDTFFGDPTAAIGGHVVAHASKTRVYLRKGKKGSRVAKLVDSPHLPDGEVNFLIEGQGIKDL